MTALAMPALLGATAMAVDVGVWYRQAERLQMAADAGAEGAARLLAAQTTGTSAYQAAALIEVNGVTGGGTNIGTLQTPVSVSVGATYSQVTVTLTSTASSYFASVLGVSGPTITATATVSAITTTPAACVLALSTSASPAIQVDNMGNITATGCPIFSDSTATSNNGAIYLNSGTISGSSIGTAGLFVKSNSGSNTVSPATPNSYQASQTDPDAALTMPAPSSTCNSNNNYTSYGRYSFSPTTFCGNVTIGGNGSTDSFSPGTYYVVNGNLSFSNAIINSGSGVTFVLTGTSPGTLSYSNNSSGTLTAPGTGSMAGVLFWQTKPCTTSACTSFSSCTNSCSAAASCSQINNFAGGSTLQASGAIYTPCSAVNVNNGAKITTASGGNFSVVAQTIYAAGSGTSLATNTSGTSSSSATQLVLTQ